MQPSKILVVDDSKLMHKMFEVMLRDYPLVHANDGYDALTRLGEHPDVDLILLDIQMPAMDGLEFLERKRQDPELAAIATIVVSTEGREEETARALEAGALAYVKKPFFSEELRWTIERLGGSPG